MSGNLTRLDVEVQDAILMPSKVELVKNELRWTTIEGNRAGEVGTVAPKSVHGCLKAFMKIADDSGEGVLGFARHYGPLGIAPIVEIDFGGEDKWIRTHYREPVALYNAFAQRAKSIIIVMQMLRSGRLVSPKQTAKMFPSIAHKAMMESLDGNTSPQLIYSSLLVASYLWHDSATARIELSGKERGPGEWRKGGRFEIKWPRPFINFGFWFDGHDWDQEHNVLNGLADAESMSEAALGNEDMSGSLPVLTSEQVAYLYQAHQPYEEYWNRKIQTLPDRSQRPSPLFNALAFYLMQETTLDEGSFFCGHCRELKTRDWKKGLEYKPRRDRAEYCEKPECRVEGRRAYERNYKAGRKAALKLANEKVSSD